jgi:hypothetical protein
MDGVTAALSVAATGAPPTITAQLQALITRYSPDELLLTGMIHDHAARLHSFAIAARALQSLTAPAPAI